VDTDTVLQVLQFPARIGPGKSIVMLEAVAWASDRDFIQRAARALRRRGIRAWWLRDGDHPLGADAWVLGVSTEDYPRAKVAFDAYVARVNRRAAHKL
jgi:hypothetical protein